MKNYGGCDVYAEKIARWDKRKLRSQFHDVNVPMKSGFQIMNHGDLWLNNMMFRRDSDNKTLDAIMIDFQLSFWGTPAIDLFYFLLSSVADDIKIIHFDDFISFYHEQLTSALKRLDFGQNIPTLAELHEDLLDKSFFGSSTKFIP